MLFYTELGGNAGKMYSFSNAVAGSSTWSFGILQFDVGNNPSARSFLSSIGFTSAQISELSGSGTPGDLQAMNNILAQNKDKIDAFSDQTMAGYIGTLDNVIDYVQKYNPANAATLTSNSSVQLAVIDYMNQFNISGLNTTSPPANTMLAYLCGQSFTSTGGTATQSGPLTVDSIQDVINATAYGSANPTAVNNRLDNYNRGMDQINAGNLVMTNTNISLDDSFVLDGVLNLQGDLTGSTLGTGLFQIAGANGQVKYNISAGVSPYVESTTYSNGQGSVTVNGNGDIIGISNATVTVGANSSATVTGSGDTVNGTSSSIITVGGNGQNSSDAQIDTVNGNGAQIDIEANSRVNAFDTGGTVNAGQSDNFGAYGAGVTVNNVSSSNVWTGGNGTGGAAEQINAGGGVVTVVDNSSVNINQQASSVYEGNTVSVNDYANDQTVYAQGSGDLTQNYGSGDHTVVTGAQATTTNYGASDYTENSGAFDVTTNYGAADVTHDNGSNEQNYNDGSNESDWSANSSDSNYDANSSDQNDGPGSYGGGGGYYGYYGYYGLAAGTAGGGKGSAGIDSIARYDEAHGDKAGAQAARRGWDEVQTVVSSGVQRAMTGARWDSNVITWSLAPAGGNVSGALDASDAAAAQQAFSAWSAASGLTFKEVSDAAPSDIKIGYGDFDTVDTGVVGFTGYRKNADGAIQAGALIRVEDTAQDPLAGGAGAQAVYGGTDASFEQVLMHEIGHALGLADNADPHSIEAAYLGADNRTLDGADVAAIRQLYAGPGQALHGADQLVQAMSAFAPASAAGAGAPIAANDDLVQPRLLAARR
jgi:predicted Zn-dependent protease